MPYPPSLCPDGPGVRDKPSLKASLIPLAWARVAMLVDREEYYDAYKAIQADGASCPVVVLVSAADCDSCAAFRTLRALFKADAVPFSAYPVAGYEEVQRHASTLAGCGAAVRVKRLLAHPAQCTAHGAPCATQERMLVLINCGGTENLHELLGACGRACRFDSPFERPACA